MAKTRTETFTEPSDADNLTATVTQRGGVRQVSLSCDGGTATWNPADDAAVDAKITAFLKALVKATAPRMGF